MPPEPPESPAPFTPDPEHIRRVARILSPLKRWHRYSVKGLEHVPARGGVLLVVHHSLATYDGFLLGHEIWAHTGRLGRGLGDDRLFQTPGVADFMRSIGVVPASPRAGRQLLDAGELVGVAPGGMWEALRPRQERYQQRWGQRRGFVRLALRAQVPMLLGACPRADAAYRVYGSRLTDWVYDSAHLPLIFARGLGPTALPRPVRITGYLAPLLHPPPHDPEREDEQVEALFEEASARMRALLARRD